MNHLAEVVTDAARQPDPTLVVAVIGGVVAIIVAIVGLVGALSKTQADRRTAWEARLDKRVEDHFAAQDLEIGLLKAELATVKGQLRAVGRVFRSISEQWTAPSMPNIDTSDIAILEDTEVLPPGWVRRSRQAGGV